MPTIQLYDNSHSGYTANITFSATTGGTYSLGTQTIPYTFTSDYVYGTYTLFYPEISQTCNLTIYELASTFCIGDGFDYFLKDTALQPDGKILCGGYFTEYSGVSTNNIVRLNSDGTIDNSFIIGSGFDFIIETIAIQTDGKIICGGTFSNYDGNSCQNICRLNPDGTFDNTFNIGSGFDSDVYSITIQPDGKILCGGQFNDFDGNSCQYICRLNSDGTFDNTFTTGFGFDGEVDVIVLQSDGKILCGGYFGTYDGNTANYLVRLNSNGTFDNTFITGSGFDDTVFTISIQTNGQILCGGYFTDYDGNTVGSIVRLNSDGTIDNTFLMGSGFDDYVYSITIQQNGSILVGGDFLMYDGNSISSGIVRLNSDGTIDYSFNGGYGFDNSVDKIVVQPNGDILISGYFIYYNHSSYNYLVKIQNNGDFIQCPNPITIPSTPFISTWRTTAPNETIQIPFQAGGNAYCIIDWGDGNTDLITYYDQPERYHQYTIQGDYLVTISGLTPSFSFYNGSTANKIISVEQFGDVNLYNYGIFFNCNNLNLTGVTDTPNLDNLTSLGAMFLSCSSLTSVNNIGSWITSGITNTGNMFNGASSFNQSLNSLDVSNVLYMNSMFENATSFNGSLSGWNVSNVLTMSQMFRGATSFNQPLSGWNVSNVTDMNNMFNSANSFNQYLNNWNVSSLQIANGMFANINSFNQPLSAWNVSNVYNMNAMFLNSTAYNQDLSHWCVTLIPSPPTNFSFGATAWVLPKPVWGTCPP